MTGAVLLRTILTTHILNIKLEIFKFENWDFWGAVKKEIIISGQNFSIHIRDFREYTRTKNEIILSQWIGDFQLWKDFWGTVKK